MKGLRKRNGDISLKFLLSIVLAAGIFMIGCSIVTKFIFHKDTAADESFAKFVQKVDEVSRQPSGYLDSMILEIYKKGGIMGFNEGSYIYQSKSDNGIIGKILTGDFSSNKKRYEVERPKECGNAKSCICLCKEFDVFCMDGKLNCIPAEYVFAKTFHEIKNFDSSLFIEDSVSGGFLIITSVGDASKRRGIYIENYKNVIGVCYSQPCFTPLDKRMVDFSVILKNKLQDCSEDTVCLVSNDDVKTLLQDPDQEKQKAWQLVFTKTEVTLADGKNGWGVKVELKNDKYDPKIAEQFVLPTNICKTDTEDVTVRWAVEGTALHLVEKEGTEYLAVDSYDLVSIDRYGDDDYQLCIFYQRAS